MHKYLEFLIVHNWITFILIYPFWRCNLLHITKIYVIWIDSKINIERYFETDIVHERK